MRLEAETRLPILKKSSFQDQSCELAWWRSITSMGNLGGKVLLRFLSGRYAFLHQLFWNLKGEKHLAGTILGCLASALEYAWSQNRILHYDRSAARLAIMGEKDRYYNVGILLLYIWKGTCHSTTTLCCHWAGPSWCSCYIPVTSTCKINQKRLHGQAED